MHLKTLTLKGFKSFADPTTLDLEPGVTVVVGPNGSGKSNVVDAIGWVLGAQAPSAVRSQKMDDVIFAGTSARSQLGRAEVSLVIDNGDGLLPIEFSEVTITRTLFRTGESEYALNGTPCRLLDIQDLLSDSGVGRTQHVIISQGQIDAVLNAKPEDRRAIIEEAAGVLKFRKRREKSQRRLAATETNLTRLQDLLREVRRQLRPLERQADAARRHAGVIRELTALRVFVAGRELASLRTRLDRVAHERAASGAREAELRKLLSELDTQVMVTEGKLSAMGEADVGDELGQFESLSEKARGLTALLAERRRSIEREMGAFIDQAVVATLEAEATKLAAELAEVETQGESLQPQSGELVEAEAALVMQRERFEGEWAEGVAAPSGKAAEIRGELAALRSALNRDDSEMARIRSRLESLGDKGHLLEREAARLRGELANAEQSELPLVESLDGAEQWRADAEAALSSADDALRVAESEHHSWVARSEALALALDQARAAAGAEHLSTLPGVLGPLVDLVEVDEGWEAAFEAAAGDVLASVIVDGVDSGREAVKALAEKTISGAVLALATERPTVNAPPLGEPIRRHVRARNGLSMPRASDALPASPMGAPGDQMRMNADSREERSGQPELVGSFVDRLLDALLGGVVVVEGGWAPAVDAAIAYPGATIVTTGGDRFGPSGWRIGAAGAGATGAALEEARQRVVDGAAAVEIRRRRKNEARSALEESKRAEADLARKLDANDGLLTAAGDGLQRVETERRDANTEAEALGAHLDELEERALRERARVADLEATLPALEAAEEQMVEKGRALGDARARLDEQASIVGAMRTDLEVQSAAVTERRQFLSRRLEEIEARLEQRSQERVEVERRRTELEQKLVAVDRLLGFVADRQIESDDVLARLRDQRRRQSEAAREVALELDGLRKERSANERGLMEARELLQRIEIEDAEVKLRIETATEALRRDLDTEPAQAMAAECPELADGVSPTNRIHELERELRIMGAINPLALQEFEALQERHQFLQQQLDDVKESRRELTKIIKAIDEEIVNVFAAAFADVSQNFTALFEALFPGGVGRLRLTDPENLLETGIEVEAKPSGKNVRKLSLLSGGERSLTALAYLFAVFRSRPSPFYVMDEVEAALDDVNLHRFLGLVDEFREEAQLVIVSHQKRTMEAADVLYGVTMQPGGSSKVVSEKVSAEP